MKAKYWWSFLAVAFVAVPSYGAVVSENTAGEQHLWQVLGDAFTSNADVNGVLQRDGTIVGGVTSPADDADDNWSTSIGGQYSSILIELAGGENLNSFGVYDLAAPAVRVEIFNGAANNSTPAQQLIMTANSVTVVGGGTLLLGAGTEFGFYFTTFDTTFFSEASLNGGNDHMVTFDVKDTRFDEPPYTSPNTGWVMGWEDLPYGSGDKDHQDMVLSLTAQPIPEPTTLIAAALLLLPFGASTLRFIRKNRAA